MRVYASAEHRTHHAVELDGGQLVPSWECPERAEKVLRALATDHELHDPEPLDWAAVERVHDPAYLEFLR